MNRLRKVAIWAGCVGAVLAVKLAVAALLTTGVGSAYVAAPGCSSLNLATCNIAVAVIQ